MRFSSKCVVNSKRKRKENVKGVTQDEELTNRKILTLQSVRI